MQTINPRELWALYKGAHSSLFLEMRDMICDRCASPCLLSGVRPLIQDNGRDEKCVSNLSSLAGIVFVK